MSKYEVGVVIDGWSYFSEDADSPEEAEQKTRDHLTSIGIDPSTILIVRSEEVE